MSGFFKRLIATGAVFTIGLSSVAMADRVMDPACCPPPPCNPCGNWCDNLCFYGAWLYWKVNCDELEYAVIKTTTEATPAPTFVEHETFYDVKGDWDSGFRIGVAFDVPDCCWGIDLNWTHFDSSSSDSKFVEGLPGSGLSVISVGLPSLIDFNAIIESPGSAKLHGSINFRYNTVDLEFGRWINCGNSCLLFRPHIGFRYADINESWKNSAEAFDATFETNELNSTTAEFHAKNKFHGAGVRVGFDADLRLCDGWSLVGRSAISLISGRTHLKQKFECDTIGIPDFYHGEIKENYRQKRAIADLAFGLRYKTLVCDCYPGFIELAWEHHYLWAQHRFYVDNAYFDNDDESPETTSGFKKTGDLAVQGLTLTLGLCF